MTGRSLLSDQSIQRLVVSKAASVSERWAQEVEVLKEQATAPPVVPLKEEVDFYDAQASEVLVMADAIQVKRQKPTRDKNDNHHQEAKQEKKARVNTSGMARRASTGGWFVRGYYARHRREWSTGAKRRRTTTPTLAN
jgi:fermentation-respiration switch protein FrsA (DUF1100 family)